SEPPSDITKSLRNTTSTDTSTAAASIRPPANQVAGRAIRFPSRIQRSRNSMVGKRARRVRAPPTVRARRLLLRGQPDDLADCIVPVLDAVARAASRPLGQNDLRQLLREQLAVRVRDRNDVQICLGAHGAAVLRSEERRVGKEWRWRWS